VVGRQLAEMLIFVFSPHQTGIWLHQRFRRDLELTFRSRNTTRRRPSTADDPIPSGVSPADGAAVCQASPVFEDKIPVAVRHETPANLSAHIQVLHYSVCNLLQVPCTASSASRASS